MAQTLADTFLADLDQLSDEDLNQESEQEEEEQKQPTDEVRVYVCMFIYPNSGGGAKREQRQRRMSSFVAYFERPNVSHFLHCAAWTS